MLNAVQIATEPYLKRVSLHYGKYRGHSTNMGVSMNRPLGNAKKLMAKSQWPKTMGGH